uniref:Borealin C-terminal domain-containing protein n=1 Tax=Cuerna arida TaxID=1464854 RepID=A0A1B6ES59_9HEMI
MTRTKQVRKKTSVANLISATKKSQVNENPAQTLASKEYKSRDDLLSEFNTYCDLQKQKYEEAYEKVSREVKTMFRNNIQELPDHIKLANIHTDIDKDYVSDQNQDPNATATGLVRKGRSEKINENADFKMPKAPRQTRARSSSRKNLSSVTHDPPVSAESFKTPKMSSRNLPSGATITPKIYNDKPITVMRRPLHGEMAISLDGSPLMVGATSREDIPTVNVPLHDGRIFSIMPEAGTPPENLPYFDETTRKYLKTLRDHLQILAPNSP